MTSSGAKSRHTVGERRPSWRSQCSIRSSIGTGTSPRTQSAPLVEQKNRSARNGALQAVLQETPRGRKLLSRGAAPRKRAVHFRLSSTAPRASLALSQSAPRGARGHLRPIPAASARLTASFLPSASSTFKSRNCGVAGDQRHPGVPGPKGTPRPIVEQLSAAMRAVGRKPEVVAALRNAGAEPAGTTPERMDSLSKPRSKSGLACRGRPRSSPDRAPSYLAPAATTNMRTTFAVPQPSRDASCALTIGNFDGLHRGHQAVLALLRAECQRSA